MSKVLHFSYACPKCQIIIMNKSGKMVCSKCGTEFERIGPGKWKITKKGKA